MPLRRILIANRGEIALRIVRAARTLGMESVVAASAADRDSMAAREADRTVVIGPAHARASYLDRPARRSRSRGYRLRRTASWIRISLRAGLAGGAL
jgi:biotin carboxylase